MRFAATAKRIGLIIVLPLFLASLAVPAIREAHTLCARLVFHLNGRTVVQGQTEECAIMTIPNVQFSKNYQEELRQRSRRSPDDFVLATATGSFFELPPPPAAAWTNHPLLEWGALRCAWIYVTQELGLERTDQIHTNIWADAQITRELVRFAQARSSTNGALWLAEAFVDFGERRDEAAVAALRIAALKGNWNAGTANSFRCIAALLEKRGLSKLDAIIEANNQMPDAISQGLQAGIQRQLQRMMSEALNATNDQRFSKLLGILVGLRRSDWVDPDFRFYNSFHFFSPKDELINAMAKRMGRDPLPAETELRYDDRQKHRLGIFEDGLDLHGDPWIVSRFRGQRDAMSTEKRLRIQMNRVAFDRQLLDSVRVDRAGGLSVLALLTFAIAVVLELPFGWLRRTGFACGALPRQRKFWILGLLLFMTGAVLGASTLFGLGIFNPVGLRVAEEPPLVSPFTKALLFSAALCATWFAGLVIAWRDSKRPLRTWWICWICGGAYLVLIAGMACFRSQAAENIAANMF